MLKIIIIFFMLRFWDLNMQIAPLNHNKDNILAKYLIRVRLPIILNLSLSIQKVKGDLHDNYKAVKSKLQHQFLNGSPKFCMFSIIAVCNPEL